MSQQPQRGDSQQQQPRHAGQKGPEHMRLSLNEMAPFGGHQLFAGLEQLIATDRQSCGLRVVGRTGEWPCRRLGQLAPAAFDQRDRRQRVRISRGTEAQIGVPVLEPRYDRLEPLPGHGQLRMHFGRNIPVANQDRFLNDALSQHLQLAGMVDSIDGFAVAVVLPDTDHPNHEEQHNNRSNRATIS